MTLEKLVARECVRDTYARYNHAGDRGRLTELADCFADDGILEVKGYFTARGRADIIAALTEVGTRVARTDAPSAGARHITRHFVANLLFASISPDRIHSDAYFTVFHVDAADHWGRYRDELVPVDDRWLFAHRIVSIDGKRPESTA